jgi:hypothetical protein
MSPDLTNTLRAIDERLRRIEAVVCGRAATVTGAQAAKLLGVSYATFRRRYVDKGVLLPNRAGRYDLTKVEGEI